MDPVVGALCLALSDTPDPVAVETVLESQYRRAEVIRLARAHLVSGQLHHRLLALRGVPVVDTMLEVMSDDTTARVQAGLATIASMRSALGLLRAADVRAVPFKGPVLAVQLYGHPAARSYVDLDLLVRRVDVPRAREAFVDGGYTGGIDLGLPPALERRFIASNHQHPMVSPSGDIVELQWGLVPRHLAVHLATEDMVGRAGTTDFAGASVPALGPTDTAVVVAVNGGKHCWERLADIADLASAFQLADVDWHRVVETLARAGVLRMMTCGAVLARRLLDAPLPHAVERATGADRGAEPVARRVARALLDPAGPAPQAPETSGLDPTFRAIRERRRDAWGSAVMRVTIPTERDWVWLRLPSWASAGYYVVRPARLAAEALGSARS